MKVYIDEKYHHATDPSIRPKHKEPEHPPAGPAAGSGGAGTSAASASGHDSADAYGKDIKDIPRSTWKLLTNKIYIVTCLGACMATTTTRGGPLSEEEAADEGAAEAVPQARSHGVSRDGRR